MASRKKYALLVAAAVAVPVGSTLFLGGTGNAASAAPGHVTTSEAGVIYQGSAAANHVEVVQENGVVKISDTAGITASGGCRLTSVPNVAECPVLTPLKVDLGDGADTFTNRWRTTGTVKGGSGADTFYGGVVDGSSVLVYSGGLGFDTVSYAQATSAVVVTVGASALPGSGSQSDGRAGDNDRVQDDVEQVVGSAFADYLMGDGSANWLDGRAGRDRLFGGTGSDTLTARDSLADLALSCGEGVDRVVADFVDPLPSQCEVIERR